MERRHNTPDTEIAEMDMYELEDITAKKMDILRERSTDDAPWKNLPGSPMLFLQTGVLAGVKWKIHKDVWDAYIEPKTKADIKRQEEARRDMSWSANLGMTPSGILLFSENDAGDWKRGDEGEDGVFSPNQGLVGKEALLAELMDVFWPDIPPLAWNRLTDVLVRREFESKSGFYGRKYQSAEDYLDFGKSYRALLHVGKLEPNPVVDWDKIINPPAPAPVVAQGRGVKPR